jgi:hypothetical protein
MAALELGTSLALRTLMSRVLWVCLLSSWAALALPAVASSPRRGVQPAAGAAAARDPYQITTVCTANPVNISRRVTVADGAALQQALDTAAAGDTILLAAGATFTPSAREGSFILRNRHVPEGQWILVRSASPAFDEGGALPAHTRVSESNAALMPQIRAKNVNAPAIKTESGARGYRLIGLDVGADAALRQLANMVQLGDGSDTTVDTEPSDIIIDRCYLHGNDTGNFRRGVLMNGVRLAVLDSYVSNFHDASGDSQAVGGSNGPGPFKIVNNFLEAASENILFGGSDPAIPQLVPSDIEISRNLSTKRQAWRAARVPVKNAFELKSARRVLVEGNTFENVWASGQDGTAILLKSTNQDGGCPWCVTEYVTFRDNIVRAADNGVLINATETGRKGVPSPQPANHIRIDNVLFDLGTGTSGGAKLFRIFGGVGDVSVTHVTSRSNAGGVLQPGDPSDVNPRFTFSYNIVERASYGVGAGGDEGIKTLARNFTPYTFRQNVFVNTSASTDQAMSDSALESRYPPTTWVVQAWNDIGFVSGVLKLAKGSRFAKAGDDGHDIGVDMTAITAAQTSRRTGDGCGPTAVPRPGRNAHAARPQ